MQVNGVERLVHTYRSMTVVCSARDPMDCHEDHTCTREFCISADDYSLAVQRFCWRQICLVLRLTYVHALRLSATCWDDFESVTRAVLFQHVQAAEEKSLMTLDPSISGDIYRSR